MTPLPPNTERDILLGNPQVQEAPMPSMAGQVVIGAAQINIANTPDGQRALVVVPAGTALSIVVPMNEEACRAIGGALLSKHVVMP